MDEIVGLRFGYFNDAFRSMPADDKGPALSVIHFILPEFINRMRDRSIDIIMQAWVNGVTNFSECWGQIRWPLCGLDGYVKVSRTGLTNLPRRKTMTRSIAHLAAALGRIGVIDDASLLTVREWGMASNNEQLKHVQGWRYRSPFRL